MGPLSILPQSGSQTPTYNQTYLKGLRKHRIMGSIPEVHDLSIVGVWVGNIKNLYFERKF